MIHKIILVNLIVLLMIVPAVAAAQTESFTDALAEQEDLTTFAEVLTATDVVDMLDAPDTAVTLFAPDNEAFEVALDKAGITLDDLLENEEYLNEMLPSYILETPLPENVLSLFESVNTILDDAISITSDDDGMLINDSAHIVDTLKINDSIIYIIDALLLPLELNPVCIVQAAAADTTRVRVGPGENRTSVVFLPADTEFVAQGQITDEADAVWYQLDKDVAAPGRLINEAWVAAAEVQTSGNCDGISRVAAPPIIPISGGIVNDGTGGIVVSGASATWVNSGITVTAGQTISIQASGIVDLWDICEDEGEGYGVDLATCAGLNVSPRGFDVNRFPDFPLFIQGMPVEDANYGALVGRIGAGPGFYIGSGLTLVAEQSGSLYLQVNDWDYPDNTGGFSVTVSVDED